MHAELLRFLRSELGDFMAPDWLGRSLTLNDLWNQNKTLIVTYSHDPSAAFSDVLWSEVRQVWGNQRTTQGLKSFLSGKNDHFSFTNFSFHLNFTTRCYEITQMGTLSMGCYDTFNSNSNGCSIKSQ